MMEIGAMLQAALRATILAELLPGTVVDIYVQVWLLAVNMFCDEVVVISSTCNTV